MTLSMDFITDLLVVCGYDLMFVMVNHFTKMTHFVPCAKTIFEAERTDLFLKNTVRLYGLLKDITSWKQHVGRLV
jgi:hypothetical protein